MPQKAKSRMDEIDFSEIERHRDARLREWLDANAYTSEPDIRYAVAWIESLLARVRELEEQNSGKQVAIAPASDDPRALGPLR